MTHTLFREELIENIFQVVARGFQHLLPYGAQGVASLMSETEITEGGKDNGDHGNQC